jgi:mitogen-activated protein kinase kinase
LAYDPDPTLPLSTRRPKIVEKGSTAPKTKKTKKAGVSLGGGGHTMSILDLLQHIVNEPAPRLVSRRKKFPEEAQQFIAGCLDKDPAKRMSPQDLLVSFDLPYVWSLE